MKNNINFLKKEKIFKKGHNQTYFPKEDFTKVENTCLAKSVSNKRAIILFQKKSNNKNKKKHTFAYNFIKHKSKHYEDKRNKTLNNTFQNMDYLKLNDNKSNKNKKKCKNQNNKNNNSKFNSSNHSNENYNSKNFYKIKYNKSYKKTNNNNITNISVCLTNINMINKSDDNYSPSFCKIKTIKKKVLNKKNGNKYNIRSQTFDYNFGNLYKKNYNNTFDEYSKKEKEKDKNKTLIEKKMRYFLDYCKDDISSILHSNYDSKNNTLNNYSLNHKLIKINNKLNYKKIDKKRHYILHDNSFSTYNYNFGTTNLSEINNSFLNKCHNISTFNKNNNINNKIKPRVDTFEYLAKILNSINTSNLIKSFQIKEKSEKISNNLKKSEKTDNFRQKTGGTILNKNKNERRFKKNNDIKKYIEIKKKMDKINCMNKKKKSKEDGLKKYLNKKKKSKEDDLKKYLQLYQLQEKIFHSKAKNKNKKSNNSNNNISNYNHNISKGTSNESTIVDKNNYYQNIIDIQNLYNDDNCFINNKIINKENHDINKDDIIMNDSINANGNNVTDSNDHKNINSKEKNMEKNIVIKNGLSKNNNESKEENKIIINNNNLKEEDIFAKCQNTLEKATKIIGGEKVEYLINNFKNINISNINNTKEEDNNNNSNYPLYDYKNDYSFKLNESNSNEYNSYQTSKFCTSQVLIEDKETEEQKNFADQNNISFKKEENEVKNMLSIQLPPTIQLISGDGTIEENKNKEIKEDINKDKSHLSQEKLDNYKEILASLFEYIKLITQRNALNDIITYGDMKYKYKIGFIQLIIAIKSLPFNIIRAIQQTQYYHFAFRQLFLPYISRAYQSIKLYSSYKIYLSKIDLILKYIFKKIIFRKIKMYKKKVEPEELMNSEENLTVKDLEDLPELKENDIEEDISESKETDSIEWENDIYNDKQKTCRDNSNIINDFTKIYQNENSYSADFNINIEEIVFENENQG